MIENLGPDPAALATRSPQADPSNRVVLRSFPKIVFLYPTLAAAVIGMVGMHWWPSHSVAWGLTFVITVALNFIVLAFDFPRTTSLTLFFAIVIVVLTILLLNRRFDILPALRHLTSRFTPEANTELYAGLAVVLLALQTVAILVHVVLDYWELTPNELIHHHGLLGDVERVPAPGLELEKEIADVFEFVLLRSGRLVIQPRTQGRAIVLENVPNVNRREREIQALLGFTEVRLRHEPVRL